MTIQPIQLVLLLLAFLLEFRRGVTISGCIPTERNALLNFKKSLYDEKNRLASWNGDDCCNWEGVSCNNVTGHVLMLNLRNPHHFYDEEYFHGYFYYYDYHHYNKWSLRGQLSPSLLDLKQLNHLDLSMNYFDGPIPKFLGSLRNLRYLNLSLSGFHGLIPHHLGNLSILEYLDLNNDGFDSSSSYFVDDSRWISRLTSLKHLTMKNTNFKSFQNWVEALNELPNIAELCLSSCHITDFPVSLPYVNFTNLSYLDLSENSITQGTIPLWLFNIESLTHIDLNSNFFGSIPNALKNSTSLQYIDFSYNSFSGVKALPQALKNLCKLHTLQIGRAFVGIREMHELREMFSGCLKDSIEHLDLSGNYLNGCLPDWFGEMRNLKTLVLYGNLLFGSIPESFGYLVALQQLELSDNKLNGTVPKIIGQLVALQELGLSNNELNGTVPKSIGQLSNLIHLYLNENSLEGDMSEVHFTRLAKLKVLNLQSNSIILNVSHDWIPPFKLDVIRMGSCKIGPHFPQWLKTQVNLSVLDLSSSDIVGILPDWFWDVFVTHDDVSSVYLDLSNNGIIGKLPPLSKLISFNIFNLSSNHFDGPLPSFLRVSGSLFDVSNNSFSGSVQLILGNITISYDSYLGLSRNNFSGEIPLSICLARVMWIDLSRNHLTGELPNCWTYQYSLSYMDLSRNNLYGTIPPSLSTLTRLESLHLSYNNLSGILPMTLRNCTSLKTLDLSMNSLTDIIPTWIGEDLTDLKALILRSNNFMGNVPSNLSKLKKLRILDLANNKLTGRIPWSFGNFRVMMHMNPKEENEEFLDLFNIFGRFFLTEYVQLTVKKRDWNYDKLLSQVTIIDLSFNNLSEQIPKELGNLHSLIFLNLSGNHLVGSIPDAIGFMRSLEFLDLSRNELSGNIPPTMSTMTALSSLDLSYNNLYGKIPSGTQLQTFTNESYIGNPKLCGFPLSQLCDSNKTAYVEVSVDEVTISDYWYVSIAPGFVLGVCLVWGTFLVKKKWRQAYFRYVDYVYDAIYVVTTVNINRIKRKIGKETALD